MKKTIYYILIAILLLGVVALSVSLVDVGEPDEPKDTETEAVVPGDTDAPGASDTDERTEFTVKLVFNVNGVTNTADYISSVRFSGSTVELGYQASYVMDSDDELKIVTTIPSSATYSNPEGCVGYELAFSNSGDYYEFDLWNVTDDVTWTPIFTFDDTHTHSYDDGVITTAATCAAEGVLTYTCSCGDSYTESIAMIDHIYSGYSWDSNSSSHYSTCTSCGAKSYDGNAEHTGCTISSYVPISSGNTHKPVYDCGYGLETVSCTDSDSDGKCDLCKVTLSSPTFVSFALSSYGQQSYTIDSLLTPTIDGTVGSDEYALAVTDMKPGNKTAAHSMDGDNRFLITEMAMQRMYGMSLYASNDADYLYLAAFIDSGEILLYPNLMFDLSNGSTSDVIRFRLDYGDDGSTLHVRNLVSSDNGVTGTTYTELTDTSVYVADYNVTRNGSQGYTFEIKIKRSAFDGAEKLLLRSMLEIYEGTTNIGSLWFAFLPSSEIADMYTAYGRYPHVLELCTDSSSGNSGTSSGGTTTHTHSYTSSVTTPATCTTEGERTYTCSCGDSYTESIVMIDHTYSGYTWDFSSSSHYSTCTSCGAKSYDGNVEHTGCIISSYVPIDSGTTHKPVYGCGYGLASEACTDSDSDGKCDLCKVTIV